MKKQINDRPLVSIITPSFNTGRYIKECIESVLSQDYPNIEHIIQDGVSTDKTVAILKKYDKLKQADKIKWVSSRDRGPVDAYNKALLRSRGEVILFLGADDALLPGAVSWGVKNMAKFPQAAVIYADEYITDDKSRVLNTFIPQPFNFIKLLCLELVPPTEASFIRRSFFEKVGFYLDESLKNAPDFELWLRIGSKFKMMHVGGFVTRYRWHSQSQSRSPNLINNFVHEKKHVMDRIFQSSKTAKKIKKLKWRAYAGLYFWAATMLISYGMKYRAIGFLVKAFLFNPKKETYKFYVSFWKQAVSDYDKLHKQ